MPARSVLFCGDKTRATSAAAAQGYRSFRARSVRHFAPAPRPMELLLDLLGFDSIEAIERLFHRFGQVVKGVNVFPVHFRYRRYPKSS